MSEQKTEIIESLKLTIKENAGEISYWGEVLTFPPKKGKSVPATPVLSSVQISHSNKSNAELLEDLRVNTIGDCQKCPLGKTRIQLVFGVGNPEAKVMFVGEGPGFDEDRQGEPFVGKAGQLLDKIMAAIGLDRTKVYIGNIVKCHPMIDASTPDNRGNDRPPVEEEMNECLPYLKEQIRIINPKIIVTLGTTATKALLGSRDGITKIRGTIKKVQISPDGEPISVLPTFHPAALLRDPELKKPVWEDMKLLRSLLS